MTPARFFAQFEIDHPEVRQSGHVDPDPNEFGLPLSPSGTYTYFQWAGERGAVAKEKASEICESLLERFGDGIKEGRVGSWKAKGKA